MPDKKILVAYSSGYGATQEVAEEIVKVLKNGAQVSVDSKKIEDCDDIKKYDAVVLGSSVRADRPLANARDFFSAHRYELSSKKLALFVISITACTPKGIEIAKKDFITQFHKRYSWLSPVSVAAFCGRVDFKKLNPVMQSLVRNVMKEKGVEENGSFDGRNWQDIRDWANELASLFTQE